LDHFHSFIVFGSENTYFSKHETKGKRYYYRENEVIRMYIAVLYRKHISRVQREYLLANNNIPHGYKLCSSPCWAIPLLLWRRVHRKPL